MWIMGVLRITERTGIKGVGGRIRGCCILPLRLGTAKGALTGAVAVMGALPLLLGTKNAGSITAANAMTTASPDRTAWSRITSTRSGAPRYEAVDLGLPEGATGVVVRAASPNFRYVVGHASTHFGMRAFLWKDGVFKYLAPPLSTAEAVNDSGVAVGEIYPSEHETHAVVWSGGMKRLFNGSDVSRARWIDNKGNIYGKHVRKQGWCAFLRSPSGALTYFETDPEFKSSVGVANQKKQVTFATYPRDSIDTKDMRYFFWERNKRRELPPLKTGLQCFMSSMNDKGVIVGRALIDPYTSMPVLWKNGRITRIKTPKIFTGWATGINNRGDIVGEAAIKERYPMRPTPFLIRRGTFYDINDLLVNKIEIHDVVQISDTGMILVSGSVENKGRAFLLKPIN
jgi:hypothetical protein